MRTPMIAAALLVAVSAAVRAAEPAVAPALLEGNIVGNPSFEYDWMNNQAEGHILAFRGDWSFNASDLKPDYWTLLAGAAWVTGDAHTGAHALSLPAGAITQAYPFAVTSSGGGGWAGPAVKPMTSVKPAQVARTIRASLWYKAADLSAANTLTLAINAYGLSKQVVANAPAAGWTRLDAVLPREEIAAAINEGKVKELPPNLSYTITVAGGAKVLIDDVSFAEDSAGDLNLAVNGSFESVDSKTGYPKDWSAPKKYTWRPPQYYRWTDWYHWYRAPRGPISTTQLIARSGGRSLQMQVYPGDEVLVEGPAVAINQTETGLVEIGAFVKLDRVKWVDIRAVDQDGNEVPCIHAYSGGQPPPDTAQIYPSNATEWVYVRKLFQSSTPLKSVRPRLCARGFNGSAADDGGTRPNCVQSGVAWWDDVRIVDRSATADELKARKVAVAKASDEKPEGVMIESLDLGERMFGQNEATVVLTNPTKKSAEVEIQLEVYKSSDNPTALKSAAKRTPKLTSSKVTLKAGETKPVKLSYAIEALEGAWDKQGQMTLTVTSNKKPRGEMFAFNTWPVIVDVDFSKHYSVPAENPQSVTLNFGVSEQVVKSVKNVVVEIRRVGNDQVLDTVPVGDLAAAFAKTQAEIGSFPKVEFDAPAPVFWADKHNLIALKLDLSKVPAHKFDEPVRDAYLLVRGLDASGKEIFRDKSQRFGRVEPTVETLSKITETKVREDGAVLINGQPVFLLGGSGYPTNRYSLTPELIKRYGFNAVRWVPVADAPKIWGANLYSMDATAGLAMNADAIAKWQAGGVLDGVVTLGSVYEHGSSHLTPEETAQHKEFGRLSREVAHRVANFGGGGAHNIYTLENVFPFYDSFGVELEPFGPPRGGLEMAPLLRKGGVAWFHLPQAYDTEPFDQFRHDQYAMILQGGRGFNIIQGLGDPSFYRGITGEVRHLSPAIFSLDKGDERTAVSPNLRWMQRRLPIPDGNKTTIIVGSFPPVEIGDWTWRDADAQSGKRAHTGVSAFAPNRTPDGLRLHGYRQDKPVMIQAGDVIVQHVWLDPKATPSSIAWGPRGDAKWDFNGRYGKDFDFAKWKAEFVNYWAAGELLPGTWQITTDAKHPWWAEHILTAKSFPVTGALPKAGVWTKLELKAEELGLVGKEIDGFMFLAKDGNAWWDHTAIVRGGKEIVLCEDSVGIPRDEVKTTRVKVPWAADGTKVKVLFEDRELVVKNGEFVDDFTGEDHFGALRDAAVGDAEGWFPPGTKLYAQTLGYTTPNAPTEVHIYEIVGGTK